MKFREEEVASRGSKELHIASSEEEYLREFSVSFNRGSIVKQPQPLVIKQPEREPVEITSGYWKIFMAPATTSIEFPIEDILGDVPMKHIPLTSLQNFHGLYSEDLDTFLFEFDIICRGYDYISDDQKLKIFPSTLKGTT